MLTTKVIGNALKAVNSLAIAAGTIAGCGLRSRRAWAVVVLLVGAGGVASLTVGQLRQAGAQEERGKLTTAASASPSGSTFPNSHSTSTSLGGTSASGLLREGTKIVNQPATCRGLGDRLQIILADTSVPLIALENLASQRILKATLDDAGDEQWVVNGQITEFQGHNFILLDRVTRQSKRLD